MEGGDRRPLSVLLYSSGNPAATFLAAGLLGGRPAEFGAILIQGIGDAIPAWEVAAALAEDAIDASALPTQLLSGPLSEPVDVGITICVPT